MLRGFTLLEIVIVIAVIIILFLIIFSAFSGFNRNYALDTAAGQVASVLDEARSLTLASKGNTAYGVHFESSQVVLFKGTVYSTSDPNNSVHTLSSLVTISDITLSGGGSDAVFERLTGKLNKSGTVTISLASDPSMTRTITLQATGIIEISI
jgi:Tfp pilus assembly protein FimT